MKYIVIILMLLIGPQISAQKHNDKQILNFNIERFEAVHIYNKYGSVSVKGSERDGAVFEVERTVRAKSNKKLEEAISKIYFDTMVLDNQLIVFINNPYYSLEGDYDDRFMHYEGLNNGNWNRRERQRADFNFDLNITLPKNTNLVVTTHEGTLDVDGMLGALAAWNHHDDLLLKNVADVYYAHSHHGDVTVDMVTIPSANIDFDTHHGDIKVSMPSEPSVQVAFDSHHGSFYTDFDWREMPAKLEKNESRSKRKAKYKLGDKTVVSIGKGGHMLSFNTHHGDMYLLQL